MYSDTAIRHNDDRTENRVFLICPACQLNGSITVIGGLREISKGLIDGISCERCGEMYPVFDGIPVMIPEDKRDEINVSQNPVYTEHSEYETEATKKVANLVTKHSGRLSLDVGCGKGPYTPFYNGDIVLADANLYFVKEALRQYRGAYNALGVVLDARYLPFHLETFDFVLCSNMIEHLEMEDALDVCTSLKAITKNRLQIDVPNDSILISHIRLFFTRIGVYESARCVDSTLEHHARYNATVLRDMGFTVRGCTGWVTRQRIRIGPLWDLYDVLSWRLPFLAGTLIGSYMRKDNSSAHFPNTYRDFDPQE